MLLSLSTGMGATIGGDTASSVNNVGQTQWNYLSHWENERLMRLRRGKSELSNAYGNCVSQRCAEITRKIRELENLSKQRDRAFDVAYGNCRSGASCDNLYYLHVTQRRNWNQEGLILFQSQYKSGSSTQSDEFHRNWIREPDSKNEFHNFSSDGQRILRNSDGSFSNTKYVHKNGQFEVIVDKNGRIVTNPANVGTYNYYPNTDWIGHLKYDVNPWSDFGNGNGDNTTYSSRHSTLTGLLFGLTKDNTRYSDGTNRLIIDNSRQEAIDKFNEADRKNTGR